MRNLFIFLLVVASIVTLGNCLITLIPEFNIFHFSHQMLKTIAISTAIVYLVLEIPFVQEVEKKTVGLFMTVFGLSASILACVYFFGPGQWTKSAITGLLLWFATFSIGLNWNKYTPEEIAEQERDKKYD